MPDTSPAPHLLVGVDTGGTFTDVTLLDPASGRIVTAKTSSTPQDPSLGFINGIADVLAKAAGADTAIARVLHGTTVATNMILEGKGAVAGLITTMGFRHVLEIGRQDIPRRANMFWWQKPARPVPPERIHEVAGRLGPDGSEVEALDEQAVRAAARALKAEGVEAIAICFLHSYTNAAHEKRAEAIVREEHPSALVSRSSEVLPVFREYERSMATILNVYVMPVVSAYVAKLEARLTERRVEAPLLLMKSSGGVAGSAAIRKAPVETALSGPAAGAVGMAFVGDAAGFRDLIGVDIGGTSADISLIKDGAPSVTMTGHVGEWPLSLPMVDIVTIGAGGGSIARVTRDGTLAVGPQSAGAAPGPVSYKRGGTEPTVTDAHLVLGHLPPYLLDGSFELDVEGARRAIATKIAEPLGLDLLAAARGILAIADHNMVGAIRIVSVERGHDPRDFALVPFGGAGPLHGGALARLLGMKTILVPPSPGVLSALGLLVSNLKSEFARTCLQKPGTADLAQIGAVFGELQRDAETWFAHERVPAADRRIVWAASLRYEHQGFELTVEWPGRHVDAAAVAETIRRFHDLHRRLYSFAQEDTPVEIVTLRVDAIGLLPRPHLATLAENRNIARARVGEQRVALETGTVSAPIYDRTRLGAGAVIEGPAIITQLDATTLLLPGQRAEVHPSASLVVRE
ncbi:MAG: hydantoinase/oxoprolinase family protein [Alphaproteobacteria bacterium]|nr:hydantoinase/oxoprolinase family protein [Alphaproteobacteria bacterium]